MTEAPPLSRRYDPKTDTWTAVAPMSVSRDAVGVCLLGDRLYAVGGYDGQVYLNTVEAYDPQTNEWTQVFLKKIDLSILSVFLFFRFRNASVPFRGPLKAKMFCFPSVKKQQHVSLNRKHNARTFYDDPLNR